MKLFIDAVAVARRPKIGQNITKKSIFPNKFDPKNFRQNLSFNGTDIFNVGPKVLIKYKTYYIIIGK